MSDHNFVYIHAKATRILFFGCTLLIPLATVVGDRVLFLDSVGVRDSSLINARAMSLLTGVASAVSGVVVAERAS